VTQVPRDGDGAPRGGAAAFDPGPLTLIVSLLDLTSLGENDTPETVRALCAAAETPLGPPAAVCVWPRFVEVARAALQEQGTKVRIATVANFPRGGADAGAAAEETREALERGAHEVDVVFPWRALLAGDQEVGTRVVRACREECDRYARATGTDPAGPLLKVILETGALGRTELIRKAARIAAGAGAHFLKTSTGKVSQGATAEAVETLLEVVRETRGAVGLKISGGVRTASQAERYLDQVAAVMGPEWITPARFRFGASSLLTDVLRRYEEEADARDDLDAVPGGGAR
jgi:deoxyribose-phosphate aldolase